MSLIRKKNAEIKNWIIQVGFKKNPHLQKSFAAAWINFAIWRYWTRYFQNAHPSLIQWIWKAELF